MSDAHRIERDWIQGLYRDSLEAICAGEDLRLTARWVFPTGSMPVKNALIEIHKGNIASIEPRAGRVCDRAVDLGNSAILPELVNAHAHLEFSDLAEPIQPAAPFADWLQNLITYRRNRTKSTAELVAEGAKQSLNLGTSFVADIVTGDWSAEMPGKENPSVVPFRELIGLLPEQHDQQLELAKSHISDCKAAGVHSGISPHAPYSVSPKLFDSLIELAKRESVPLCIHLAETQAELELLQSGSGELVAMLEKFGLWQSNLIERGTSPMDYLRRLADLPAASIAHGNYLGDEEIRFLAEHTNITTVFCPRTHDFFGHSNHPWERLLDAGASVALGTDGRSSNPDYSLSAELWFLDRKTNGKRRPDLLRMATVNGARALGLTNVGMLDIGSPAFYSLVPLAEDATTPWESIFRFDPSKGCLSR